MFCDPFEFSESSVQTSRLVASSSTSIDLLINQFALEIETNPSMAPSPMMMFNFAMRLGFRADGVARVMKDSNPFPVKILHFLTEWRSTNSHTDEVVLKRLLLEHIQGARMAHILDLMPEGMQLWMDLYVDLLLLWLSAGCFDISGVTNTIYVVEGENPPRAVTTGTVWYQCHLLWIPGLGKSTG